MHPKIDAAKNEGAGQESLGYLMIRGCHQLIFNGPLTVDECVEDSAGEIGKEEEQEAPEKQLRGRSLRNGFGQWVHYSFIKTTVVVCVV